MNYADNDPKLPINASAIRTIDKMIGRLASLGELEKAKILNALKKDVIREGHKEKICWGPYLLIESATFIEVLEDHGAADESDWE